jgi:hypothetical protein
MPNANAQAQGPAVPGRGEGGAGGQGQGQQRGSAAAAAGYTGLVGCGAAICAEWRWRAGGGGKRRAPAPAPRIEAARWAHSRCTHVPGVPCQYQGGNGRLSAVGAWMGPAVRCVTYAATLGTGLGSSKCSALVDEVCQRPALLDTPCVSKSGSCIFTLPPADDRCSHS